MTLRSPSELARLSAELAEAIEAFLDRRTRTSTFQVDKGQKAARQALLNEIRRLETILGYEGEDYNNSNFRPYYERLLKELT